MVADRRVSDPGRARIGARRSTRQAHQARSQVGRSRALRSARQRVQEAAQSALVIRPKMRLSDPRMRPWLFVLVGLYAAWFAIEIIGDRWLDTLARWPIALVMVLGSYLAGSTPMGGG